MTDKGYTTADKIKAFLNITTTDSFETYILATQKIIDNITGRNFKADTEDAIRLFNGPDGGGQELLIDDIISITTVEIGDNAWGDSFTIVTAGGADGYRIDPPDENYREEREVPITKIILRQNVFHQGIQNQRITGKWGYSVTPPDDITFAATVLAAGMYNFNRGGGSGTIKSEKIGNYSVGYDTSGSGNISYGELEQAKSILDSYTKLWL